MSDERLRELERLWRATRAPADGAAYLLERVRAGQLTQSAVELLAHAGDEAACEAARVEPGPQEPKAWTRGLLAHGALGSRAACIVAFTAGTFGAGRRATEPALRARAAAILWINCPCKAHEVSAQEVMKQLAGTISSADTESGDVHVLHCVVEEAIKRARRKCVETAERKINLTCYCHDPACSPDAMRAAICADIRRWIHEGVYRFEMRA